MRTGYLEQTPGTRGLVFVPLKLLIIVTCVYLLTSCGYFTSNRKTDPPVASGSNKALQKPKVGKSDVEKKPAVPDSGDPPPALPAPTPKNAPRVDDMAAKNDLSSAGSSDPALPPLFKKHNHTKYLEKIRDAATEIVEKQPESVFARLCRDSVIDEWSLSVYYFKDKDHWFQAYKWDEVDEKWQESFKSDKRPIALWKNHVKFSASGKECNILKGESRLK
jgi:hypothetical protein